MREHSKAGPRTVPGTRAAGVEPGADWAAFQGRLTVALGQMAPETYLVLTTREAEHGAVYYVQFAHATAAFRAEAVGSDYLPADHRLTGEQEALLATLGWEPPAPGDAGRNHHRTWPVPPPFEAIAAMTVRTLREVFGIGGPGDLEFAHSSFVDKPVPTLDLGIHAQPRPSPPADRPSTARSVEQLVPLVEEAIRRWLGVAEVRRDADGDYPVRIGSTAIIVRLHGGTPPVLSIFSPILRQIGSTPDLLAALNELNARMRFGRVFWTSRTVVVASELAAVDLTANQVALACMEVGSLADRLDDVLHGRFGGQTMFTAEPRLLN